jgi:transcriptional regulator of heat shock response
MPDNATRDLNEREQQILQAVVHMYVTEAEPVGSRSIVKRFDLDLSPATVRNVMADLEELGYLEQCTPAPAGCRRSVATGIT